MQAIADLVLKRTDPKPLGVPVLNAIPKCESLISSCKTIAYAPQGVPWVKKLMQKLALDNGLNFEETFLGIGVPGGPQSPFDYLNDNRTLTEHFINNFNATQTGIIFLSPYFYPQNRGETIPNDLGYWMFYNSTQILKITMLALEKTIGNQMILRGNISTQYKNNFHNRSNTSHLTRETKSHHSKFSMKNLITLANSSPYPDNSAYFDYNQIFKKYFYLLDGVHTSHSSERRNKATIGKKSIFQKDLKINNMTSYNYGTSILETIYDNQKSSTGIHDSLKYKTNKYECISDSLSCFST